MTTQAQNTPRTFEDVLALENIEEKIRYLKAGRRTPLPNTAQNRKDWNPRLHDIMDEEKYKKIKVLVEMEKTVTYEDANGIPHTTTEPAKYEMKEPNRIALPIEQDIVNIQTSFTVGTEPEENRRPNSSTGSLNLILPIPILRETMLRCCRHRRERSP